MDLTGLSNSAINIVLVLAILVALVVIHEFGHFMAARRAGVRVHEFGIGLPPRALTYHRSRDTAYTLNWLPLGGFVRLEGEDGDSEDPRSFTQQPLRVRTAILLAGVAMNIVLAFVVFTFIAGFADPSVEVRINGLAPATTSGHPAPSVTAGLQPGKVIGGTAANPVYDDSGDLIVAIDGQQFAWFDAGATGEPNAGIAYLKAHAGQQVVLTVKHADGTTQDIPVLLNTKAVADAAPLVDGTIGQGTLGIRDYWYQAGPALARDPLQAITLGAERTAQAALVVLNALANLFGNLTNPQVAGPIGIVSLVGQVRTAAPPIFLVYLVGLLSANLAVVNALPIPPFDGGRVLVGVLKRVMGARYSVQAERATYLVGFVLLFAFIVWISYFDIARLGGG
ncbi:MAG: M50 family metallopeptidase [Candidatus Limnocylindrales bacterium]